MPSYDESVWKDIKHEWLAGQLSKTDISRSFGPSRQAINAKAERYKWGKRGTLVDEVRKEIDSQLLDDEGVTAGVPPQEADEIVQNAAKRGVVVVRRQRNLLTELLDQAAVTLQELREMAVISSETLQKKRTKHQAALVTALSKARLDGMRVVSAVLSQAIPLERQSYSLDDDQGNATAINYTAPEYRKPKGSGLSEDDWDDNET